MTACIYDKPTALSLLVHDLLICKKLSDALFNDFDILKILVLRGNMEIRDIVFKKWNPNEELAVKICVVYPHAIQHVPDRLLSNDFYWKLLDSLNGGDTATIAHYIVEKTSQPHTLIRCISLHYWCYNSICDIHGYQDDSLLYYAAKCEYEYHCACSPPLDLRLDIYANDYWDGSPHLHRAKHLKVTLITKNLYYMHNYVGCKIYINLVPEFTLNYLIECVKFNPSNVDYISIATLETHPEILCAGIVSSRFKPYKIKLHRLSIDILLSRAVMLALSGIIEHTVLYDTHFRFS